MAIIYRMNDEIKFVLKALGHTLNNRPCSPCHCISGCRIPSVNNMARPEVQEALRELADRGCESPYVDEIDDTVLLVYEACVQMAVATGKDFHPVSIYNMMTRTGFTTPLHDNKFKLKFLELGLQRCSETRDSIRSWQAAIKIHKTKINQDWVMAGNIPNRISDYPHPEAFEPS